MRTAFVGWASVTRMARRSELYQGRGGRRGVLEDPRAFIRPPTFGAVLEDPATKVVHREALERERQEAEVPEHGHLEELHGGGIRHRVGPLRQPPVGPERPEESAHETAPEEREPAPRL